MDEVTVNTHERLRKKPAPRRVVNEAGVFAEIKSPVFEIVKAAYHTRAENDEIRSR
jgi:hypothetical protein